MIKVIWPDGMTESRSLHSVRGLTKKVESLLVRPIAYIYEGDIPERTDQKIKLFTKLARIGACIPVSKLCMKLE